MRYYWDQEKEDLWREAVVLLHIIGERIIAISRRSFGEEGGVVEADVLSSGDPLIFCEYLEIADITGPSCLPTCSKRSAISSLFLISDVTTMAPELTIGL